VTYKFYKAQVTGGGYLPQGHCQASLTLDQNRAPTWTDVSEEFERICMPSFEATMRIGPMDKFEPLKPYSEEAMEHLSKRQLPGLGFMMVTVKDPASAVKAPPPSFGFQAGIYSPPPGLFASPPKPANPQAD
jgi:hypothetical protein